MSDPQKKHQYDNKTNIIRTNINPHDLFNSFFKHQSPNVHVSNINSVFHVRSSANSIQKSTIIQNGQIIETIIEIKNGVKTIKKSIIGQLVY